MRSISTRQSHRHWKPEKRKKDRERMSVKTRIDDTIIIIDGDGVMGALVATLRPKPGRKSSLYGSKRLYE